MHSNRHMMAAVAAMLAPGAAIAGDADRPGRPVKVRKPSTTWLGHATNARMYERQMFNHSRPTRAQRQERARLSRLSKGLLS